jgi:hypothetical protein
VEVEMVVFNQVLEQLQIQVQMEQLIQVVVEEVVLVLELQQFHQVQVVQVVQG